MSALAMRECYYLGFEMSFVCFIFVSFFYYYYFRFILYILYNNMQYI
jgi:hypothetical protein